MQAAEMTATDLVAQTLQAVTQLLGAHQRMMAQQGPPITRMPKMMTEDDPEAFLEAFEWQAIILGLDKAYWVSQQGALVVGKAQEAYRTLSREEARDYEAVKAAILYRLEINPEHYRRLFRTRKGPKERRPRVLLQRLRDLFGKWVSLPTCTLAALVDKIVMEQFINDLEERTQRWVRQHSPESCEAAVKLAESFMAAEWHYLRERRGPVPSREMERQKPGPKTPNRDVVCFHCGKMGHFARGCPGQNTDRWRSQGYPHRLGENLRDQVQGEPMDCSFGARKGEPRWERPTVRARVEGRPLSAVLDLGCAQSLIRAELLPPGQQWQGEPIRVACLHGETQALHRARVRVHVMEFRDEILVGVAPKLACDMLLGRDWAPLYDVLERVRDLETAWRAQWVQDEWFSEAEGEEPLVDWQDIASGPQFRQGQEEDPELHELWTRARDE
uniref:CCHC-type domain-containing protein n=1 Tax=Crocodylus porosus TaxID=8502 RepID=A0A7M4EFE9_CROPO